VILSEKLECLILGHGLEIPYLGEQGRTTSVGQLWFMAKEKYGECSADEMTDALFRLQPDHAELKKYVYNGTETQVFRFARSDPHWRDFFNEYFNISVSPAGRQRFEILCEKLVVDDRKFARMAIDEARKSVPEPDGRPHPLVGAVVVKNGQVLSVAHRGEAAGNHAEFIALEKKLSDEAVAGATVYTTLEPCTTRNHPKIPCAARLIERKVARVVIGMHDPDERITGRGWLKLRRAGIVVESFPPELVPEVEELNREFTRHCEQQASPEFGVAELQKQIDLANVSARIEQGTADFIAVLTNESDETIRVTEVGLLSERGVRLTEPHLLKQRNAIEPRKWLTVDWRTQTNPANKLVSLQSAKGDFPRRLPNEFETELEVIVTCEVLGKVKHCKTRLHVKVDIWNHRIEQIAG
jgi:pyrimidine deaminase RibD-like protein